MLWLAPTQRAVRDVESRLLRESGEAGAVALFAPNIYTFDGFAEAILAQAGREITPVSPACRRLLLRQVVQQALAAGQLRYFGAIAQTTGFHDLVEAFIAELKREEAWPERFEEIVTTDGGSRRRDLELARLYRDYQALLQARQLYDTEGRFWSARQALAQGAWGRFDRVRQVVVDGFADFTRTQIDLVCDLATRAGSVTISMPGLDAEDRPDLFAKTRAVAAELRVSRPVDIGPVAIETLATPHQNPALAHIAKELFINPRLARVADSAPGVTIEAVAGAAGEGRAVAARVKQLLAKGMSPGDLLVTTREPGGVERLRSLFALAGIPVAAPVSTPLARTPHVRLLLSLLRLERDDWPFDALVEILQHSLFAPKWESWVADHTPMTIGLTLRRCKLPGGRRGILEGLARRLQPEGETPAPGVAHSWSILLKLERALARIRPSQTLGEWVEALIALAGELGLVPPAAWRNAVSRDQQRLWRAWDLFERSLFGLKRDAEAHFEPVDKHPPDAVPQSTWSLDQWLSTLADLLEVDTVPETDDERGCVRILDPVQARHVDCRVLFITGLTETSFPSPMREDCFFSDRERAELHRRGLALAPHASRLEEEQLLFWSLVTRPREQLVLSYPLVDAKGSPLSPSPYLVALQQLFTETALKPHFDERLDPLPSVDRLLTARDLRLHATHQALEGDGSLFVRLAGDPAFSGATAQVAAAFEMHTQRFQSRGFSRFEGWFSEPAALQRIAARFSSDHEFSATQLEDYARCPFRFLMERVGKIQPLPDPLVETDLAARGSLVHEVLARLHREIIGDDPEGPLLPVGVSPGELRLATRFTELVSEELGRRPERDDLQAALLRLERRVLGDLAESYQQQWNQYVKKGEETLSTASLPARFESGFGEPSRAEGSPQPMIAALELGSPGGPIRIGGRIDRIDLTAAATDRLFVVIDYKTGGGKTYSKEHVRTGRQLQLALYALAIQRLGLVGPNAFPWQLGYWNLGKDGFSPIKLGSSRERKWTPLDRASWHALVALVEHAVPTLVEGMRRGEFPVFNTDRNCTDQCPLRTTCRVGQIRALPEGLAKRWEPIPEDDENA
jgi:ATP-dependent helicase/nuclease subunit B